MSNRKTLAVAVSGGLDSFLAYRKALWLEEYNVIPYFVDYGQPYLEKEVHAVKTLVPNAIFIKADLVNDTLDNVPTLTKQEIYGRNILIAFYGSLLAEETWLAALETEMNPTAVPDKHPEFFHMLSALFSATMKSKRLETRVRTPFAEFTKSEIIGHALKNKYATEEEILRTSTCYHEVHKNCGGCSTCFKRWIALTNNGLSEYYVQPPYENPYAIKILNQMRNELKTRVFSGRFTKKRFKETDSALSLAKLQGLYDV